MSLKIFYKDIQAETCCEICNEVIHNHLDCPVCGEKYEGTDAYRSLWEDELGDIFSMKCGATFKLVSEGLKRGEDRCWELQKPKQDV